jgi:hypothetical protein
VPGEIFPTRYRSTAHGISAASGKFGGELLHPLVLPSLPTPLPPPPLLSSLSIYLCAPSSMFHVLIVSFVAIIAQIMAFQLKDIGGKNNWINHILEIFALFMYAAPPSYAQTRTDRFDSAGSLESSPPSSSPRPRASRSRSSLARDRTTSSTLDRVVLAVWIV